MSLPVIVIRPEPGCSATVAAGTEIGLPVEGFPLFNVAPRVWDPPARGTIDGLLVGSANAFRCGGTALRDFCDKPVFAVGEATASAARQAGFEVALVGTGRLQGVLDQIGGPRRLLRLAGAEHVPLTVPPGIEVIERVVYASEALPLPPALEAALRDGTIAMLHSGAAAAHFAGECERLQVPRDAVRLAALGPRIAREAGPGWQSVHIAPAPTDGALLALAADLWHNRA